jgi:hypothetical protein
LPLSEHEQRLLEQIEQALYAEDPKFASLYRSSDLRTHYRRRVVRATIVFVLGLGLLLAGVTTEIVAMGVAGFVVMLAAASLMVASLQRMNGRGVPVTVQPPAGTDAAATRGPIGLVPSAPPRRFALRRRKPRRGRSTPPGRPAGPKLSLIARLEQRWQRRYDDRR